MNPFVTNLMNRVIGARAAGVILLLLLPGFLSLFADEREWSDRQGRTITAELLEVHNGEITIRRDDGREFTFSVDRLSEGDREYVAEYRRGREEAEASPEPTGEWDGPTVAPERFEVEVGGRNLWLPYASNRPIDEPCDRTTRILISIHGSAYNAMTYLRGGVRAAGQLPRASRETLVVAPHLLRESRVPPDAGEGMLYWRGAPFWGSQRAYHGPDRQRVLISAYDVLDRLLLHVADPGRFPNLEHVVVAGHSAGGQLVNRYAAASSFDLDGVRPDGVRVRYVVMAPSSYVYFDGKRPKGGTEAVFVEPESPPGNYNNYGRGLQSLYVHLRDVGADVMRERYRSRHVYYLVGENDNDPRGGGLGRSPASMLQGRHRLERQLLYYDHLGEHFGPEIYQRHHQAVVPGVGHSGPRLMRSQAGLRAIFDYDPSAPSPPSLPSRPSRPSRPSPPSRP